MKKFLERTFRKLQQDNIEKKKKQIFDDLVEKQKEKLRLEFFVTNDPQGRNLGFSHEADGVKFANLLNALQTENNDKVKKKHELEEQIENLGELEEHSQSQCENPILEEKKKELVNWSVNLSPEVFMRKAMELGAEYNEHADAVDVEFLKEKYEFLMNNYEGIQTQLVKEQEVTSSLDQRITSLQEEQNVLTKRLNEAKHVHYLMEKSLIDTQKIEHTAKNKLALTANNLHLLKSELQGSKVGGKEYIERLNEGLEGSQAATKMVEEKISQMLVKLEQARAAKKEFEEKLRDLNQIEQANLKKIRDSETTIRYIDILASLENKFLLKQNTEDSPASSARSNSISPAKKFAEKNMLESPRRRASVLSERMNQNRSRASSMAHADARDPILRKIIDFCGTHNVEELIDRLLNVHRILLAQEYTFKEMYEKHSLEKRKKEDLLKELSNELLTMMKNDSILIQYEKSLGLPNGETSSDFLSITTINQMEFTFKELQPLMNDTPMFKSAERFLAVSYVYLIETMSRISRLLQGISKKSHKVSYEVVFAFEDVNKYLSEMLNVPAKSLVRAEVSFTVRRKERTSTGIMEFLGRARASDSVTPTEVGDEKTDRSRSEGVNVGSQVSLGDKKDTFTDRSQGQIFSSDAIQTLTRAEIIKEFQEVFPNSLEKAKQWADLIGSDQIALLVTSKETIQEYLKKQLAEYGVQTGLEKAFTSLHEFRKNIRDMLQERFVGMFQRFEKVVGCIQSNKQSLLALEKDNKSLLRTLKVGSHLGIDSVPLAPKERVLKVIKQNDIEEYEVKTMIGAAEKNEEKMTEPRRRKSKSLDEVRDLISTLVKDRRAKVNEHYTKLSKDHKLVLKLEKEASEIPEETKIMMKKSSKDEFLPPIKAETVTHARRKNPLLTGGSAVPTGLQELTGSRRVKGRQTTIIPTHKPSASFYIEQEHLEQEREKAQKEDLRRRCPTEGAEEPVRMSVKKDKTPEKAPSRFDEIMKNPVKKVYENNRALEQLAKLERIKSQSEHKPAYSKKKKYYLATQAGKPNESLLDINRLRRVPETSHNGTIDKRFGSQTPLRGINSSSIISFDQSPTPGAQMQERALLNDLTPVKLQLNSNKNASSFSRSSSVGRHVVNPLNSLLKRRNPSDLNQHSTKPNSIRTSNLSSSIPSIDVPHLNLDQTS